MSKMGKDMKKAATISIIEMEFHRDFHDVIFAMGVKTMTHMYAGEPLDPHSQTYTRTTFSHPTIPHIIHLLTHNVRDEARSTESDALH